MEARCLIPSPPLIIYIFGQNNTDHTQPIHRLTSNAASGKSPDKRNLKKEGTIVICTTLIFLQWYRAQ